MEHMEQNHESADETARLEQFMQCVDTIQNISAAHPDYRILTDAIQELSGAVFVALNLATEEGGDKTTLKAVSGPSEGRTLPMNASGFKLTGTLWDIAYAKLKSSEEKGLIRLSSRDERDARHALPWLDAVLIASDLQVPAGDLYGIELHLQGDWLGFMTLIMAEGQSLKNGEMVEHLVHQIGRTIMRLRKENMLQQMVNDLQQSEVMLKTYVEKSPVGIFVADHKGQYVEVNMAACTMSGYSREELLDLSIADFLTSQFLDRGMKLFQKILAKGYGEDELKVRKKNGEIFWIHLSAVSIPNNRVIAFCQDTTERKHKEEQAKELNCLNRFAELLHTEKNSMERILAETVTLLPPAFQCPENMGACIHFKGLEFRTKDYVGTPWKISASLELNGGEAGYVEVSYLQPPPPEGELFSEEEKMMVGTIAQHLSRVAEQFQAKTELQESKNLLLTTLHSIGDGVIATDMNGNITQINRKAQQLTGWAAEEAVGKFMGDVFQIMDSRTGAIVSNPMDRVLKTGETQTLADNTILVSRTGSERYIADSAAPIRDFAGNMAGVIMVFSDMTERKMAEESMKYQFRFEKMLAEISTNFASKSSDQLEAMIQHALEQIGDFFQVDRSYVYQFSEKNSQEESVYEWCADGIGKNKSIMMGKAIDAFPWLNEKIHRNQRVSLETLEDLPSEAHMEKAEFQSQGIQSLLYIPLQNDSQILGFFGLEVQREERKWTENQEILLGVLAELISNALVRRQIEAKVRFQSFHDGLTGLYNRVYLEEEMQRLDTERQIPIGIIMADLNGLKRANDTYGHFVGDEMLKKTAEILTSSCRKEDISARWGGDEFVVFLPQTTEKEALAICQRIQRKCRETFIADIPISVALGDAVRNSISQDLNDILKEAEENMYKNKRGEHIKL